MKSIQFYCASWKGHISHAHARPGCEFSGPKGVCVRAARRRSSSSCTRPFGCVSIIPRSSSMPYPEPHGSAEASGEETVERARRVDVDGVAAGATSRTGAVTSHCGVDGLEGVNCGRSDDRRMWRKLTMMLSGAREMRGKDEISRWLWMGGEAVVEQLPTALAIDNGSRPQLGTARLSVVPREHRTNTRASSCPTPLALRHLRFIFAADAPSRPREYARLNRVHMAPSLDCFRHIHFHFTCCAPPTCRD